LSGANVKVKKVYHRSHISAETMGKEKNENYFFGFVTGFPGVFSFQ